MVRVKFLISLFVLCVDTINAQKPIDSILVDGPWNIYKTVENQINNSGSHQHTYQDSIYSYEGYEYRTYANNQLGGPLTFDPDWTGDIQLNKFFWSIENGDELLVKINTTEGRNTNTYFFGRFSILEISDSSIVLLKDVSGNGNWTRTFYFEKFDVYKARRDNVYLRE